MRTRFLALLAVLLTTALPAAAGDLAGRWTAEFDSPIGVQKYVYEFQKDGDALSGQATYEHSMGKGTVPLKNIKLDGDKISFDETVQINGADLHITYSGTLAGDEMKLTRVVGDFGTEQLTAKRASAAAKQQ